MKAAISKRKWTRLLTFYITFTVIFVIFVLLLYTHLKRRTLCFELPKEVYNNVSKTSLIIEKLWSIWSAFILFCTSDQSDNYKNEDEVKEQLENLCKNSYLSTETLKLILLTHLPQDIHIVLEAIHKYFTDSFENVISEKLLTVYICLVGSLAILIANRILLPLLKNFRDTYIERHLNRPQKCRKDETEIAERRRVSPVVGTVSYNYCRSQAFLSVGSLSKFLLLSFLLSLLWEFVRLYQRKMAEHASAIVKGIPSACDPHSMSAYDGLKEYLRHQFSWSHALDACKDYYYALLVDPLWEVSPLMVISSVFTQGLLYPLEVTCTSLGRSFRFFFLEIPAQWQPLILFVLLLTILFMMLMLCSYRLHIPLLFKLEPVTTVRSSSPGTRKLRNDFFQQNMLSLVEKKCDSCNLSGIQFSPDSNINMSLNGHLQNSSTSLEDIPFSGYRNDNCFHYSAKTEDLSNIDSLHQTPPMPINKLRLKQKDSLTDNSKSFPILKVKKRYQK